jgi:ABC-type polar amino acid transport system ATPase subunit
MDFAMEVADRAIVFDKGDIIEIGHPEEIFISPKMERIRIFLSRVLKR